MSSLLASPAGIQYNDFAKNLTDDQLVHAAYLVSTSKRFELDGFSHIRLRGSNLRLGFIGSGTLEFCYEDDVDRALYRTPYRHLKKIFKVASR